MQNDFGRLLASAMELRTFETLSLDPAGSAAAPASKKSSGGIRYTKFTGEAEIPVIMDLVDTQLSEPYNLYTYRYFLNDW